MSPARRVIDRASRPCPPEQTDYSHGLAAMFNRGYATAFPILRRAVKAIREMPVEQELRWLSMAYAAALTAWDADMTRTLSETSVRLVMGSTQ